MPRNRSVAVGTLTRRDLDLISTGFRRAFPLTDANDFASLLIEIDQAEERCSTPSPAAISTGHD
jgi:hypothetical protein